jgi:glycosyltransferase involved in cell wall biosynthesis
MRRGVVDEARMAENGMLFVATEGRGSMDLYSQRLAARLGSPVRWTGIYQRSARRFGLTPFGREALRLAWTDARFVRSLRTGGNSPIHLPNQHLARYGRLSGRPYIVTVHDLIRCTDRRRDVPLIGRPNRRDRMLLALDCAGIRAAKGVIAVSACTRDDLVEELGVPSERIVIVHNGLDHDNFRPSGPAPFDFPYVLFVGSEQPRKNLATLLRAFRLLASRPELADLRLVKVGPAGSDPEYRRRTEQLISELGLGDRVTIAPWLSPTQLARVYSGAACLVIPSLYEGFGQVPLEAMACGCPVIASRNGSLGEVVGDAALTPRSGSPEDLARAVERLIGQPRLAEELVRRGLERAGAFTWERTAAETRAAYERLLAEAPEWAGVDGAERPVLATSA